jgi:hypothetical protein
MEHDQEPWRRRRRRRATLGAARARGWVGTAALLLAVLQVLLAGGLAGSTALAQAAAAPRAPEPPPRPRRVPGADEPHASHVLEAARRRRLQEEAERVMPQRPPQEPPVYVVPATVVAPATARSTAPTAAATATSTATATATAKTTATTTTAKTAKTTATAKTTRESSPPPGTRARTPELRTASGNKSAPPRPPLASQAARVLPSVAGAVVDSVAGARAAATADAAASSEALLASAAGSGSVAELEPEPASAETHPSHVQEAERRRRLSLEAGSVVPMRSAPEQEPAGAHSPPAAGASADAAAAAARPVATVDATTTSAAVLAPAGVSNNNISAVAHNSSAPVFERGHERAIAGVASTAATPSGAAALGAAMASGGASGSARFTLAAAAREGAVQVVLAPRVVDLDGRGATVQHAAAEARRADLGSAAVIEQPAQERPASLSEARGGTDLKARAVGQVPSATGCAVAQSTPARTLAEVREGQGPSASSQSWTSETVVAVLPSLPAALAVDPASQRVFFVADSGQGAAVLEWADASARTLLPARPPLSASSAGSVSLLVDGVRGWLFVLDQGTGSGALLVVDLADGFLLRSLPLAELGASGRGGAVMVLCPRAQFLVIGGSASGLVVVDVHTWRSWRAASSAGALPLAAITSLGVDARGDAVLIVATDPSGSSVVLRAPFSALARAPPPRQDARSAALVARQLAAAESSIARLAREDSPAGRVSALLLLPEGRARAGALAVHGRAGTWAPAELPAVGQRATVWTPGGAGPVYAASSAADGTALVVRLAVVLV